MTRPEPLAALVSMRALPCFADRSVAPEQPMRTRSSNDHRGASTGTPATPSRPHTYAPVPSPARRPPAGAAGTAHMSFLARRPRQPGCEPDAMHAHRRRQAANGQRQMDQTGSAAEDASQRRHDGDAPASATTSTRSRRPPGGQVERDDRVQHGVLGVMGTIHGRATFHASTSPAASIQPRTSASFSR